MDRKVGGGSSSAKMQGQGNGGGSSKACDSEATGQLMMLLGLGAKPCDDAVDHEAAGTSIGDDDKADTEQKGNGEDEEVNQCTPSCTERRTLS